jgi:hypothetical protein
MILRMWVANEWLGSSEFFLFLPFFSLFSLSKYKGVILFVFLSNLILILLITILFIYLFI